MRGRNLPDGILYMLSDGEVAEAAVRADLDARLPQWRELQAASRAVRHRAYAPFSDFQVGAAVLGADGRIAVGCNVENSSYSLTICAERVAVCTAITLGIREFVAICVSLSGVPVPCGACRQFLVEFNPEILILLDRVDTVLDSTGQSGLPELVRLGTLLPRPFRLER
jgi:cytidine deaminase